MFTREPEEPKESEKDPEVPKHRRCLSKEDVMQLMRLLISAIEPVSRLIDAISRIR